METENIASSELTVTAQHEEIVTFDQVYARHWRPLYRTALRMLGDQQSAEDIIQDAYVRLWENWNTMPHTNIKGWLFTTTYYMVLDRMKQRQSSESIEQAEFAEPLAPGADELLRTKQLQLEIDTCVETLPEQCRRVYTMSRHNHLSIKTIALQLGISPKTVEYHVTIALRRIRQSVGSITLILLFLFI